MNINRCFPSLLPLTASLVSERAMVSSLLSCLSDTVLLHSTLPKIIVSEKPTALERKTQPGFAITKKPSSSASPLLLKSAPLATSLAILLWTNPANAGILSGFPGIESTPGPELPRIEFLEKLNEENQKKYAEFDERFKSSPLLKELIERSKLNKEKNRKEIQDKYCIRGAEWGVGDCSAEGMSPADRDKFIATLKQKLEDGAK